MDKLSVSGEKKFERIAALLTDLQTLFSSYARAREPITARAQARVRLSKDYLLLQALVPDGIGVARSVTRPRTTLGDAVHAVLTPAERPTHGEQRDMTLQNIGTQTTPERYGELPKNPEQLVRLAREQGWEVDSTTAGHTRMKSPSGRVVVMGKRQGDWRAIMNVRAQLKRFGLKPGAPPPKKPEPMRPPTVAPPMRATLGDIAKTHDCKTTDDERTDEPIKTPTPETAQMKTNGNGAEHHEVTARMMPPPSPAITDEPAKYGTKAAAMFAAIARTDMGKGVTPADIVTRMKLTHENSNAHRIGIDMANACKAGKLIRRSVGRYSLSPTVMTDRLRAIAAAPEVIDTLPPPVVPAKREAKKPEAKTAAPAVPSSAMTPDSMRADVKVLEDALAALANMEAVILKHMGIAQKNAELVGLLAKFTQGSD